VTTLVVTLINNRQYYDELIATINRRKNNNLNKHYCLILNQNRNINEQKWWRQSSMVNAQNALRSGPYTILNTAENAHDRWKIAHTARTESGACTSVL